MQITLNIVAENPQELQEAVQGLSASYTGSVTTTQEEKLKKQESKRNTKSKSETADRKKEKEKPAEKEPEKPTEEKDENIPSVTDLRAAAQEKAKEKGKEGKTAVKALLDEFESKSISAVPEEKRAEFLERLKEL